jgi:formate hydrogenlyase subunit 6/NADH:ubiquinone oxidoreductase subunit I
MEGRTMSWRDLPNVDERHCTACGDCIWICPTECLSLAPEGVPLLQHPLDCISCQLCAEVCPTEAIVLRRRWCA